MQGMAQQLILDRRVGGYVVPQGWFIWAAGNRKEDRAAAIRCIVVVTPGGRPLDRFPFGEAVRLSERK